MWRCSFQAGKVASGTVMMNARQDTRNISTKETLHESRHFRTVTRIRPPYFCRILPHHWSDGSLNLRGRGHTMDGLDDVAPVSVARLMTASSPWTATLSHVIRIVARWKLQVSSELLPNGNRTGLAPIRRAPQGHRNEQDQIDGHFGDDHFQPPAWPRCGHVPCHHQ